ncbi:methyl-accepting chemotaxis protein [Paraliobacillus sp. JSM ZJ581]|uniref:methyl-accepting chemotaxis protein n=1 Tax=Paraliobacillus sp. JSM ZJ581 TaxID=3342118 RepID=UPI0035A86033
MKGQRRLGLMGKALNKISIRSKILITIAVAILTNLFIGGTGLYNLHKVQRSLEISLHHHAKNTELIRAVGLDLFQRITAERALHMYEPGTDEFKSHLEDYEKQKEQADSRFNEYVAQNMNLPKELEFIEAYKEAEAEYEAISDRILENISSTDPVVREQGMLLSYGEGYDKFNVMEENLDVIGELYNEENERMREEVASDYQFLLWSTVGIIILCVLLSSILGWVIIRAIKHPIDHLRDRVKQVAQGDLTVQIQSIANDELGVLSKDFRTMVDETQSLITTVGDSIQDVSASAEELTAISEETTVTSKNIQSAIVNIADGASQQASLTEAAHKQTLELSDNIQRVSEKTKEINGLSSQAEQVLSGGVDKVRVLQEHTVQSDGMQRKVAEEISRLSSTMENISSVVQTINDITEKTKLLALNASIEAARAGEAGQGFAVVATEIRNLATQSSEATGQIKNTISNINYEFRNTLAIMKETEGIASKQSQVVTEAGTVFESMFTTFDQIITSIHTVGSDMQQMEQLRNHVVKAIKEISNVAAEAASTTETIGSSSSDQLDALQSLYTSAEQLHALSEVVSTSIAKFKVDK